MALTGKQLKFAVEYVKCLNKTEAARRAGYAGNDMTLGQVGYENLKKPEILAFVNKGFDEDVMSAREVLRRISQIAAGDIDDVVDEHGAVDLSKARERGVTGIIKTVKSRNIVSEDSDIFEIETVLHDKLRALEILAKYHSLLVDKVQIQDWHSEVLAMYRQGVLSIEQITDELGVEVAQELLVASGLPVTSS